MPNVIQDKFKVVVGLGIVNWFKSGKSMKLGMLVGIGHRKKIRVVAKMIYD